MIQNSNSRIFLLIGLLLTSSLIAQVSKSSTLFNILASKDSLLFNAGFNTCDIRPFEILTSDNFEFYHDKEGITTSKSDFILSIKNGLCKSNSYQSRRELVKSSLEVFPLKDNGIIYGAIQKGVHRFYEKMEGRKETYASTAKFSHVWILENGEWKISRVLSYDHKTEQKL